MHVGAVINACGDITALRRSLFSLFLFPFSYLENFHARSVPDIQPTQILDLLVDLVRRNVRAHSEILVVFDDSVFCEPDGAKPS